MATATIKGDHIEVSSIKYFRAGADRVQLAAYGEKKTHPSPWADNYLAVQDRLPAPKIEQAGIRLASIIEIDTKNTSQADVEAHLEGSVAVVKGGKTAKITFEKLKDNDLKLVHLVIQPEDLKDAFNDSPKALGRLRDYGGDARAVNDIFVVVEADLAESFTASAPFGVKAAALGLEIEAKAGGKVKTSTEVTFSEKTTFAYLLQNPKWERGKDRIKKFSDDQWGMR